MNSSVEKMSLYQEGACTCVREYACRRACMHITVFWVYILCIINVVSSIDLAHHKSGSWMFKSVGYE